MGQHGQKQRLALMRVNGRAFAGARVQRGQGQVGIGLPQVQDQRLQARHVFDRHLRGRRATEQLATSPPQHLEFFIDGGEELARIDQRQRVVGLRP